MTTQRLTRNFVLLRALRWLPLGHLLVPAQEPAPLLGDELAPERAVGLDLARVVGVERPLHALVHGAPPALAAAIALGVVLDEAVLLENPQVVARRATRLAQPPTELGCGGRPVLAQASDQPQPQRVGHRAEDLRLVDLAELW